MFSFDRNSDSEVFFAVTSVRKAGIFSFLLGLAVTLVGCIPTSCPPGGGAFYETRPDTLDALARDTNDPYIAANMKRALVALVARNAGQGSSLKKAAAIAEAEDFDFQPNFLYVRFLPKGAAERRVLFARDPSLVLFDTPMSYRVDVSPGETGYLDTTLPDSVTPYFAAVPADYSFGTEIAYEIIKPLFLIQPIVSGLDSMDQDSVDPSLKKIAAGVNAKELVEFLDANGLTLQDLETAALELTGNLDEGFHKVAENGLSKRAFWDRWRPKGTLKYRDTQLGDVPVVGVRVTAGYSYYWRSSRTDANGYFSSPERWTYSVKYKAHWDAEDFLLEDHESWYGADLVTEGPTSYQPWNRTFVDENAVYAVIFTAAHDYYYNPIGGLNRPRQNGLFNFALDLQISSQTNGRIAGTHTVVPWLANWIVIWTKGLYPDNVTTYTRPSRTLYGYTIHELAHSAHYAGFQTKYFWVQKDFEWNNYVSNVVQESFAAGIEWWLTNRKYSDYTVTYNAKYTGVIQDLIDDDPSYARTKRFGDGVRGFTIQQIERAVMKSFTMSELKANLKEMYPSGSGPVYQSSEMDALFEFWSTMNPEVDGL
jgi:hypothetical protein